MDENQPVPPGHPESPYATRESPEAAPAEPFYKRHGLAFAVSTLVLGSIVLLGSVIVGTAMTARVISHSVTAFTDSTPAGPRAPGDGHPGGGGADGMGTQRELVRGTLESTSGSRWSVTTATGATITVKITSATAFGLPQKSGLASDFVSGDEVIVLGRGGPGDTLTATRILKFSSLPRPGSTPGPTPGSGGL